MRERERERERERGGGEGIKNTKFDGDNEHHITDKETKLHKPEYDASDNANTVASHHSFLHLFPPPFYLSPSLVLNFVQIFTYFQHNMTTFYNRERERERERERIL